MQEGLEECKDLAFSPLSRKRNPKRSLHLSPAEDERVKLESCHSKSKAGVGKWPQHPVPKNNRLGYFWFLIKPGDLYRILEGIKDIESLVVYHSIDLLIPCLSCHLKEFFPFPMPYRTSGACLCTRGRNSFGDPVIAEAAPPHLAIRAIP